uniref:ethanolamine-phosphate cytidylyltransferase n=1 Tax=Leptocylindrus danicus TaxID=163516 RepID=A0A7S2KLT8_9STRA|mmetsp:Transcript_23597/g.35421  ORF Transcript_23597/g.35421 Transcript_23597/m.35421 type:complete len:552 (+) Transcript_23597:136-1791(+)
MMTNGDLKAASHQETETTGSKINIELFLTPAQKLNFSQYEEIVDNKSLTNMMLYPLFQWVAKRCIPKNIGPNLVTAAGLICLFQAWYLTNSYYVTHPVACTWLVIGAMVIFFVINSVDSIHAQNLTQTTALMDLFKYSCDTCSTVFVVLLVCYCLGMLEVDGQWYAVQSAQLLLFTKHLSAFHRTAGLRYNVLSGPGEVLTLITVLLVVRATLGLDFLLDLYDASIHKLVKSIEWLCDEYIYNLKVPVSPDAIESLQTTTTNTLQNSSAEEILAFCYYTLYTLALTKVILLKSDHNFSRFGLICCLSMRSVPAILHHTMGVFSKGSVLDVICDGLFMAVLTSDVTLAKMSQRELHPYVVVMSLMSSLSHSTILLLVILYFGAVFIDLSSYLNMPLFSVCVNVYCDGVYDLCHIGHKQLFQRALGYGNRLYVGVCNDEDCSSYKRPPVMTHEERCAEVQNCKSVTKVIPNAPCFGLTKEFIDKHQIHVVAYGEEYLQRYPDPNDDPYYGYPRKIGIARPMPRFEGLSTSKLIQRIVKRCEEDAANLASKAGT